ncbi:MAG: cytochrome c peroxidase [Saprospiraceae bacterium]|jgi:cytochrome c peroxidase|nr:cytochrome c peroxidase [Saprospiraceae bacterium]
MKIGFVATSILGLIVVLNACTKDRMPTLVELDNQLENSIQGKSPNGTLDFYVLPNENDLHLIPQDPKNPLTPQKVELGKLMYHDTGLGQDPMKEAGRGTYSCASCHVSEAGFRPGNFQGIADGGVNFGIGGEDRVKNTLYSDDELDVQSARPLSMVNVAYVSNTFWNGQFGGGNVNEGTEDVWDLRDDTELNHLGFEGIETQNMDGLIAHRITINKELLDEYGYTFLFDQVFADVPVEERYTIATASLAFSAYIRTILANRAPFQDWLKGDREALGYEEKKGAILFFEKAQCIQCHYNQNLGSSEFHALGVTDMDQIPSYNTSPDDRRNLGRGGFTLQPEDNYRFRVPGIYNLQGANFYFHGASKTSIRDLVEYKNAAQSENSRVPQDLISSKFKPIGLTEEEKYHLIAFLENGLQDPDLKRYVPTSVLSGNCFPNADEASQLDLGCN